MCTHVISLAVQRSRVVAAEECFQQVGVADHLRVERDFHALRMTGIACAYCLIVGIGVVPARVARNHLLNAFE
ncbi:hypothetical protein D3C87_1726170 [compost metagenome]